ncbi:unnamed protein product (macronuclear) [Paramecium tetraurelia]|uniref:Cyclic nucleotide-binding domain-containing protein n=1 Tax=Paramecium tetraurelia TaxID=5888 RepID=A0BUH0_PARTE|nr:uncharacterized protein GSPATT00032419001 [Paramecium tetraurelia]CAK62187.1 unnamed protein product [Paramecium tetraurelia]|eukprot:XP_001429585.1 hypothetical protein (macronuclear) [Paramecium tetraurelia strain d4-2]
MSSYIQSQFTISDKQMFDFTKPQPNSDSDEEKLNKSLLLMNNKDYKKQKKLIDIESIKSELNNLPPFTFDPQQKKYSKKFQKASLRTLSNTFVPTSPVLIEQLGQVKAIKHMKEQIPPEIMHKVYTQLRYQYFQAFNMVYRQGDQNKYYYIILDGRCVVLKPKEKMVGMNNIEVELEQENKTTIDPYGLKSLFPEYMMMKMLFSGDSFGEVAIKLETSRASTVFAVENTHLLYMTEAAYVQLLDPYLSEALEEKIQYFKKNTLFTSADSDLNEIMGILLECRKITYKAGEIIYEEGSKSNSLFFIINGEVQLSKRIGERNLVLSSYGENQQFGEVEILNKVTRFTTARAISPRLIVYKIRKNKFFNNLGNFIVYDNMKKQSKLILQHWNLIYKSAMAQISDQNNVYLHIEKRKTQEKRKKYHSNNHSMSQVQVFQNITESGIINDDSCELQTEEKGQRVFSNALQQYQQKLKKFGNQNYETQTKQVRELTHIDERAVPKVRQRKLEKFSFHAKLPSISPNKILPQMNLDQVLDSITRLPKVPQDNLILSLMYQEAYKSNNPDKKARQVQQLIQASFKKVRKYQTSKEPIQPILNQARFKSTDSLLKNLKINESLEEKKEKIDYLNFVQPKKIF